MIRISVDLGDTTVSDEVIERVRQLTANFKESMTQLLVDGVVVEEDQILFGYHDSSTIVPEIDWKSYLALAGLSLDNLVGAELEMDVSRQNRFPGESADVHAKVRITGCASVSRMGFVLNVEPSSMGVEIVRLGYSFEHKTWVACYSDKVSPVALRGHYYVVSNLKIV